MTLNINWMSSDTKIGMLLDTMRRNEIDIALLQEVVTNKIENMPGYITVANVGREKRGTALLAKEGLQISDIRRLPTGRGIAASIENTWIINIYAPIGTARKTERENFYNAEITHLIPQSPIEMILAGDFNCTQASSDCTGTQHRSAALGKLIKSLDLTDAWSPQSNNEGYTH
jgi:exonuclease III